MTISAVQQEGLSQMAGFNKQVDTVVKEQALIQSTTVPADDLEIANKQASLRQIVKTPEQYGFVGALLADGTWDVTFDAWAASPAAADYEILVLTQKYWYLLTGLEFLAT